MKTDEQDDLWRLLGRAKAPTVSPFFSRNVLRAIREEKQEEPGLSTWLMRLNWRWVSFSAGACALVVVLSFVFHAPQPPLRQGNFAMGPMESGASPAANSSAQPPSDVVMVLAQQVSTSPDYQVINHLDELLASEETSVWLDK